MKAETFDIYVFLGHLLPLLGKNARQQMLKLKEMPNLSDMDKYIAQSILPPEPRYSHTNYSKLKLKNILLKCVGKCTNRSTRS